MTSEQQARFYIVDVFTQEPFSGNPLAVIPDAASLNELTMQRIAREFNQSETTFLFPSTRPNATCKLRSFTPTGAEVFGAGHNSLGAWWWLAESGRVALQGSDSIFHQEIGDRVLPVEVLANEGSVVSIGMQQELPLFAGMCEDLPGLANALGLNQSDLVLRELPAQVVSTGVAHLMVPVKDRIAVERIRPDSGRLRALLRAAGGQGCYVFCLDPIDPTATVHARFFNPTVGIWEDPATGSAAGPLACLLARHGIAQGDAIVVEQGLEVGRPSRIEVRVSAESVGVLGSAVIVAEGTLHL